MYHNGVEIGKVVFNEPAGSLDAHCHLHRDSHLHCAVNRTVRMSNPKVPRGRPLAFLLAWLRAGADYTTRDAHFAARLGRDEAEALCTHTSVGWRFDRRSKPTLIGPRPAPRSGGPGQTNPWSPSVSHSSRDQRHMYVKVTCGDRQQHVATSPHAFLSSPLADTVRPPRDRKQPCPFIEVRGAQGAWSDRVSGEHAPWTWRWDGTAHRH